MTTHVFIVDSTTFKLHLEYLFAGTGARDNEIDFNNNPNTSLHATTENMLIGMIADGSRVRQGDQIVFYLQQEFSEGTLCPVCEVNSHKRGGQDHVRRYARLCC